MTISIECIYAFYNVFISLNFCSTTNYNVFIPVEQINLLNLGVNHIDLVNRHSKFLTEELPSLDSCTV